MKKKWSKGGHNQEAPISGQKPSSSEKCLFVQPCVQTMHVKPTTEDKERDAYDKSYKSAQLKLSTNLNRITAIGAALSFLAFIGLCVSLYFTRNATQAASKQAETSRLEFESSQRPWVAVTNVNADNLMTSGLPHLDYTGITVSNVGHSVAMRVVYHPALIKNDDYSGNECKSLAEKLRAVPDQEQRGIVLFPGESATLYFPAFLLPGRSQKAMQNGSGKTNSFTLEICVTYNSTVDLEPHYTKLMYFVQPKENSPPPASGYQHVSLAANINLADAH